MVTGQVLGTQGSAGGADREDLSVCCGIFRLGHQVGALGENLTVAGDDGGEGPPARSDIGVGESMVR